MTERRRRFLVVTLDAAGNWPPELVLVRTLVDRGHEVRVMTNASHAARLADAGATCRSYDASLHRDPAVRRDETPEEEEPGTLVLSHLFVQVWGRKPAHP